MEKVKLLRNSQLNCSRCYFIVCGENNGSEIHIRKQNERSKDSDFKNSWSQSNHLHLSVYFYILERVLTDPQTSIKATKSYMLRPATLQPTRILYAPILYVISAFWSAVKCLICLRYIWIQIMTPFWKLKILLTYLLRGLNEKGDIQYPMWFLFLSASCIDTQQQTDTRTEVWMKERALKDMKGVVFRQHLQLSARMGTE